MPNFNNVVVLGRLTADPALKHASGVPVCEFSLAVSKSYTKESGEKAETTTFVDIEVWRRQAEICAQFLKKGRHALVMGELKQDRWSDKETGKPRSKLKVVASRVNFIDKNQDGPQESPVEADASEADPLQP